MKIIYVVVLELLLGWVQSLFGEVPEPLSPFGSELKKFVVVVVV